MTRPDWDEYFISFLDVISKRATCDRGRSSALIVKDNRVLSTGYVGSPSGLPHCDNVGHQMFKVDNQQGLVSLHCYRTLHAEHNAILQAARKGYSVEGATMYSTMEPCRNCAMAIIAVGIIRVVAKSSYHASQESKQMFKTVGIELVTLDDNSLY